MDQKTAIEVSYDDYVWEIDDIPADVVAAIESAKQAGRNFVELTEDRRTGSRIWLSVDSVMAVYDWREEEQNEESERT